ncbi:Nephrocystin-4 [Phytophthora ramorum]|uniref:Nephrocystin-4 n=1 Tax=Phytophthora ramorum TaxID=164328 RepID=UPI0030A8DFAB|nr:Nephrocystin-4 [Phytophthora ramorum]
MVARAGKASASSSGISSPSSSSLDEDSLVSSDSASESEFSTDSESHTAPSARRARNARVSRRRWRKSHNPSASTSALLPPAEPASTSLWTTREKQFEKFRSSLLSMPVPDGVVRIEKAKGYSLHVMSVLNWVLPDSILHSSAIPASSGTNESEDDEEEPLVTLGVHVSLFHAVSKRFFGNTWVSPELAVDPFNIKQARHPKDGTLRYVVENALLNFRAYFISDIIDANCVGVLELVAYEKDPDSKATVRIVGCGWTILPLFARQQPVQSGDTNVMPSAFSLNTSGDSVSVFTGSPRALWELNPDAWSGQEKHEGSKFYYQLVQYEPMMSIAMFLRKNELVGALDPIPGLKNGNLANIDMGKNPKMLLREEADTTYEDTLASFVKIASLVPKAVHVEDPFELTVIATRVAINLRDEIEANLIARLRISRKAIHEGATSVEGEVSARVLKIALHNGRCFRTRQFTVPLKADPNGGDTLLCVRNHSKLRGFVFHPNMAIVVVLQYTVHFRIIWPAKLKQQALEAKKPLPPEEDVVLVTMGARALIPSDGKKLYLYDKHHHATAISAEPLTTLGGVLLQEQEEHRRVLHVDLLSGAPCRPYSDNTLYTPPDQVTRSLQSREVSVKDSFAFCDLKITIDEDVPAVGRLVEEAAAPASPAKPTENNQTAEKSEDCAADQWARKLLGKANSNPVLAHTLNALAAAPTAKEKAAASLPKTPSPTKKQPVEHPTSLVPDAPTSELSRASKTLLTRYGYMESHDKPTSSPTNNQEAHAKRQAPKKVEFIAKSIETEVKDPFKANEIRFHFAAYRGCSPGTEVKAEMACSPAPLRVYFTFQFYNFPPTRTETLRLSKAFDNGAGGEIQTYLLMRETPANKPSLAIQFDVDTTSTKNPLETRRFAEYLKWNSLYVDVWDADSLFQLGTFAIPLHELLRQGNSVKKFQAEVEISPPLGGTLGPDHTGDGESSAVCTVLDTKHGTSIGRVQLLMSSYGLKGENFIDQTSTGLQPPPTAAGGDQEPRKAKHRVRARPLVETNAELYRLLSQEGFYGDKSGKGRRERMELQPRQRQGLVDANTLTPKEIAILCDLFGARKSAGDAARPANNRSTRIKCDLEDKTGLLALLSLRPPKLVAPKAEFAEDQLVPVPDTLRPPQQKPVAAAQRLKRVVTLSMKNRLTPGDVSGKSAAVARLRTLLEKAKDHGVDLKKSFAHFDANGDGEITRGELKSGLVSLGCFKDMTDGDFDALLEQLDEDGSGKIDFSEFRALVTEDGASTADRLAPGDVSGKSAAVARLRTLLDKAKDHGVDLKKSFAHFDANGDGEITRGELKSGLVSLGCFKDMTDGDFDALLEQLDEDGSGKIDFSEFRALVTEDGASTADRLAPGDVSGKSAAVARLRTLLDKAKDHGVDLKKSFAHFDANGDGEITRGELKSGLVSLGCFKDMTDGDFDALLEQLDEDGSGKIDFSEFRALVTEGGAPAGDVDDKAELINRLKALMEKAIEKGVSIDACFAHFDKDGDGTIKKEEFVTAMTELGFAADPSVINGVIKFLDRNESGAISLSEFKQLFPTSASSPITSASTTVDEAVANKTPETQSTAFDEQKSPTDEGAGSDLLVDKKTEEMKANSTDPAADETKESTAGSVPTGTDLGASEEATRVEGSTAAEGTGNEVPKNAVPQESEPAKRRPSERLVRSSSFKKPEIAGANGAPFRRTKTDPKAVSAEVTNVKEKAEKLKTSQRVSFAAVKAAKRAELAAAKATKSEDTTTSSLGKEASKPWKSKPAETPKAPGKSGDAGEPAPVHLEQATKEETSGALVNPIVQHDQKGVAGNLDCNYAFNANPEIRAVELKLRQTALDAYQRGILPLRVVSKFLEDADDRRGRVPGSSGRERSRKKRSELLRVEFLQVLMELGFTLLSDQSEDDERGAVTGGGMPRPVTKMNDHLYARQLERLSRYRQHIKNDESKAHKQLVRAAAKAKQQQPRGRQQAQDSLRRFEDEKNQLLRVLSYYRDGHKKSLVYSLLRQQVTTSLTLFPSFGDLLFFELPFTNPYNHNDRFRVELLLPSSREIALVLDLEIVRSSEEWAFYRENLPLAYGFITSDTAVENEMIDDHDEVVMDSHDELHVPMRLRWLDTSDSLTKGAEKKNSTIPVSVVIKSCSHGHTVALFNMELQPQPFACQRVLRFSHPASSIWRWKLKYPRGKFIVCMDPSVAMELLRSGEDEASNSGLASFKCRVGEYPALETFYVVLYDDKYYARVYEVWQIRIQSKLRVDVHAVLGQSVRHELVIKGDGGSGAKRHVMCFAPTQHCDLMQFRPGQVFALVPQAFNRIEFAFCAVETGTDTQTVVLVNLVDVETHELVGAWSVHVTLALPVITKTYALRLPVGRAAQKKISYSNPWDQPQTIMLRSSAPRLVVPREPVLQLPGNGQAFLRLAFAARSHSAAASEDIYLFINDKRTDQNEECLLFQVTYE